MGVYLGRLGVGVTEELLDRSHRLAGGGEARRECVAQVVKADHADPAVAAGLLEALCDLAAIERVAGLRVGEDEIVVAVVGGPLGPAVQFAREAVGHRHRPSRRELGLALARVLAANEGVAYSDSLYRPVDVAPAETEQLALPKAGHRCGQDDDAEHWAEHVWWWRWCGTWAAATRRRRHAGDGLVGDGAEHGLELLDAEELQVGLGVSGSAAAWAGRAAHGVLADEATVERLLEDRVQERHYVADGLWRAAALEHRRREGLDVRGRDVADGCVTEAG